MAKVTERDTEKYEDLPESLFPATGKFRLSNNTVINLLSITSRARTAFVSNLFITDILRFPPLPLLSKLTLNAEILFPLLPGPLYLDNLPQLCVFFFKRAYHLTRVDLAQ